MFGCLARGFPGGGFLGVFTSRRRHCDAKHWRRVGRGGGGGARGSFCDGCMQPLDLPLEGERRVGRGGGSGDRGSSWDVEPLDLPLQGERGPRRTRRRHSSRAGARSRYCLMCALLPVECRGLLKLEVIVVAVRFVFLSEYSGMKSRCKSCSKLLSCACSKFLSTDRRIESCSKLLSCACSKFLSNHDSDGKVHDTAVIRN